MEIERISGRYPHDRVLKLRYALAQGTTGNASIHEKMVAPLVVSFACRHPRVERLRASVPTPILIRWLTLCRPKRTQTRRS